VFARNNFINYLTKEPRMTITSVKLAKALVKQGIIGTTDEASQYEHTWEFV